MRRQLGLLAAAMLVVAALAGMAFAGNGPEKKVRICHFADDHTAPAPWSGGGTTLVGDYVLNYAADGPTEAQVNYCTSHGGLGVIEVSAKAAEKGHHAQLLDRVAGYPGR